MVELGNECACSYLEIDNGISAISLAGHQTKISSEVPRVEAWDRKSISIASEWNCIWLMILILLRLRSCAEHVLEQKIHLWSRNSSSSIGHLHTNILFCSNYCHLQNHINPHIFPVLQFIFPPTCSHTPFPNAILCIQKKITQLINMNQYAALGYLTTVWIAHFLSYCFVFDWITNLRYFRFPVKTSQYAYSLKRKC